MRYDPYAGTSRGGEMAAAALGVVAADAASVLMAAAILHSASGTANDEGFPRISDGEAYGWMAFTALALPAGAAVGAWLAANPEAGGSIWRAWGYGLLAELAGVAVSIPLFIANPWLGLAATAGWQLGFVPWAASRGMHPATAPEVDKARASGYRVSAPPAIALQF